MGEVENGVKIVTAVIFKEFQDKFQGKSSLEALKALYFP